MTDTTGMDDFYEEDEPLEKIVAAFERGEKGVTRPPDRAAAESFQGDDLSIEQLREIADRGIHPVETVPPRQRWEEVWKERIASGKPWERHDDLLDFIEQLVAEHFTPLGEGWEWNQLIDFVVEHLDQGRKLASADDPRVVAFPHAEIDYEEIL